MKKRARQGTGRESEIGSCQACGGPSHVTDSRTPIKDKRWIQRRRSCRNRKCGNHWISLEISAHEYKRLTEIAKLARMLAPLVGGAK